MNLESSFNYRFPASKFTQGGKVQYMATLPYKVLMNIFTSEHQSNAMKRSQRLLDKKHASDIANYICSAINRNQPYILPTIVASVDGECFFEPNAEHSGLGMLNIPMDSLISTFDGQHRIAGIIDAIKRMNIQDSISILFVPNADIKLRQQFFSDINSNATKPSKSLCLAYDKKSVRDKLIYSLYELLGCPEFIDLDHNAVPVNSNKTMSYKQFYDATRIMFDGKPEQVNSKEFFCHAKACWERWFRAMSYQDKWLTSTTVEYRRNHIGYHGIFVTAWAMSVARLRKQKRFEPYQVTSAMAHFWLEYPPEQYVREKWNGICVNAETGKIILSMTSKLAITDRYCSAIMKKLSHNN